MCYYKSIRREQKMTIIIVLAAVLDVGFIGGIVYLIFGKLLHSNALGKLFGIVAGIACGAPCSQPRSKAC